MDLINHFLDRPIYAIFIVVLVVMVFTILRRIIAKNKAELSVILEKETAEFNQQILGLIEVKALKNLQIEKVRCRLKIYAENRSGNNNNNQKRIYKDEFELSNPVSLRQGQFQEFNFSLDMPNRNAHQELLSSIQGYLEKRYKVKCIITAKVYCDGVNLQGSKDLIYIHKGVDR